MLAFSPPNKQETKSCPQLLCQLPVQFLFVQGSFEPEVLTLRLLVLLGAPRPALTGLPGMWGRRHSPAGPPLISTHWPSGLFSLLCTQLGLGSGNFLWDSAFFFLTQWCHNSSRHLRKWGQKNPGQKNTWMIWNMKREIGSFQWWSKNIFFLLF